VVVEVGEDEVVGRIPMISLEEVEGEVVGGLIPIVFVGVVGRLLLMISLEEVGKEEGSMFFG